MEFFKLLIFIFFIILTAGSRFDEFVRDPNVQRLLESYKNKEIKTQNELHAQLQPYFQLSLRTLKNYLQRLPVIFFLKNLNICLAIIMLKQIFII